MADVFDIAAEGLGSTATLPPPSAPSPAGSVAPAAGRTPTAPAPRPAVTSGGDIFDRAANTPAKATYTLNDVYNAYRDEWQKTALPMWSDGTQGGQTPTDPTAQRIKTAGELSHLGYAIPATMSTDGTGDSYVPPDPSAMSDQEKTALIQGMHRHLVAVRNARKQYALDTGEFATSPEAYQEVYDAAKNEAKNTSAAGAFGSSLQSGFQNVTDFGKGILNEAENQATGTQALPGVAETHRLKEYEKIRQAALAGEHPFATPVGRGVGSFVSPESLAVMAATAGIVNPAEAGIAEDLAQVGLRQGVATAASKVAGAGASGGIYGGTVQTAQQAAAGEPVNPLKNIAVGTGAGVVGSAGGQATGALTEGLNPIAQAGARTAGNVATAGGINVGIGEAEAAITGQKRTNQERIADFLSGAAPALAADAPGMMGDLIAARDRIRTADPKNSALPKIDAQIAQMAHAGTLDVFDHAAKLSSGDIFDQAEKLTQKPTEAPNASQRAAAQAPAPQKGTTDANQGTIPQRQEAANQDAAAPAPKDSAVPQVGDEHNGVATVLPAGSKSVAELAREQAQQKADTEAFATLMHNQREQRISTYTPEAISRMTAGQLHAAADDLGVTYDAPGTTIPRITDAIQRRSLDMMSPKELYDEAQRILRENHIAGVKAGNREQNIQVIQAWRQGHLTSNWTPESAPLPAQRPAPAPGSMTPAENKVQPSQNTVDQPTQQTHTADSLQSLPAKKVYEIAKDLGIKPRGKSDNIVAILAQQEAQRAEAQGKTQNGSQAAGPDRAATGATPARDFADNPLLPAWVNAEMKAQGKDPNRLLNEIDAGRRDTVKQLANDPVTKFLERTKPAEADRLKRGEMSAADYMAHMKDMHAEPTGPVVEVNKPKAPAAKKGPLSASDMLLRHGVADGVFPNDWEAPAVHPDVMEGATTAQKTKMLDAYSEDRASEATAGMSAAQREQYERSQVARFATNKTQRVAEAIEHYRQSPDPTLRKLAAYADAEGTGPKTTKPVESFNHGDEFMLGDRHFRVEVDADGNTHFIDTDMDIPYAEGTMKMNTGSLKKAPTFNPDDDFAPKAAEPSPRPTTGQGSLLGERYEGSNIGSKTGSMFGDMRQGAASELEAQQAREAEQALAHVDKDQTSMFPGKSETHDERPGGSAFSQMLDRTTAEPKAAKPTPKEATNGFIKTFQWLRSVFAPQTASPAARETGNRLRQAMGEQARNEAMAKDALAKAHWFFDGQTKEANQDFIDRFQAGERQLTPELQKMADTWSQINRDQTRRMDELDPDMKRQWEESHIKQIWKETAADPDKVSKVVAQLISKRPLEGSKGFLKKKTYLTYKEGREAGLTPLYDNPVDAMMYGFSEAEKFIQMRKFANETIHSGVAKYIRAGEQVPDGMATIDDPAFTVYAPPTISVNEYVNRSVHDALQSTADALGIRVKTVYAGDGLSRGALGTAVGDTQAIRRFGTDIGTLAHEIGHNLDARYNLRDMFKRPGFSKQLAALADEYEPQTPSETRYRRSGPEKMAAMLDAYMSAPDTFRRVAPDVYRAFDNFLHSHEELAPLAEFERSLAKKQLTTEIPRGGITKMGSYALPKDMADVIGSHLSRGFKSNPIFKGYMAVNNGMSSLQLMGAFHAGFTSMDSSISRGALAIEQLANGRPVKAVRSMLSSPLAPVTNAYFGHKLITEYLRPGTHPELSPVVEALTQGGARVHQDSALQNRTLQNMVRAARQGDLLGTTVRIPGAAMDAINWPIMEKLVPMQKWGVMGDLMREELDRLGPNAKPADIRASARKVVDTVDNRLGQVVYDNLFINRKAKDLLMGSLRSVGWNLGTVKEVGGGIVQAPQNALSVARGRGFASHNTPYVLAMLGMTAAAGALYQYLKTGQYPQTLQDYYQPKTGRKDENGDDIRVQLPTYMRDVMAATHDVDAQHPGKLADNLTDMATSKVAPLPSALMSLARNKDYYGTQIANPDDSIGERVWDRAKFLASQSKPFTIQGMQKQGEDVPLDERAGALVGLTPTPRKFIETPAEELANSISQEKYGGMTRTQAQADKSQYTASLVKMMKTDPERAKAEIQKGLDAGRLNDNDAATIAKKADTSALQWHLRSFSAEDAIKVYDAANPQERTTIEDQVRQKILDSHHTPAEQDKMLAEHHITPPEDLALDREHKELNEKATADEKRQQQLESLRRQISTAESTQDWQKGAALRKQWSNLRDQPPALTPAQKQRLTLLRAYVQRKNEVAQRVKEGSWTAEQGQMAMRAARSKITG